MSSTLSVALAGNPNSGKTTVFNALTGSDRHVGNWPGKTVERWEGVREHAGHRLTVVDLPGTYSLTASSLEEAIARDVLVENRPDVVVVVVDAAHLERNLFLATQILEFGVPVIVGLNMVDTARAGGIELDAGVLADRLGVPVVPMVARKGIGVDTLLASILDTAVESRR
ncbi:MAG: iron transporter FeoB [Acidimicrobiia bacterium]|nr:iron transporter FeoB [Acidimicrobiia bacterium]